MSQTLLISGALNLVADTEVKASILLLLELVEGFEVTQHRVKTVLDNEIKE